VTPNAITPHAITPHAMTHLGPPAREQGFALVIVLWSLGLLALLIAGITASSRTEIRLANAIRGAAVAEAAADGAVQRAIFQLRAEAWPADGRPRRIAIGQAVVDITIDNQTERINPNFSSPSLLAALLGSVGLDPAQARDLARRIVDWRTATPFSIDGGLKLDRYREAGLPYAPPDRPFTSVAEIGLVAGMTPQVLASLRPYLSIYQVGDAGLATGANAGRNIVQDAEMINHAAVLIGFNSPYQVVQIRATALLANGIRFVRTAEVRLPAQPGPNQTAWQIMTWD
jgi:general secretion pathway protein K